MWKIAAISIALSFCAGCATPQPSGELIVDYAPFLVNFDHDSTALDVEAASIIKRFIEHNRPLSRYTIGLTGHTDTTGSAAYNMALSRRRAQAVKLALIREGVPADIIFVLGRGKTNLWVQTRDGVEERQNRRVNFDVNAIR